MPQGAPPNGGAALPDGPSGPRARVAQMRAKLHRWAAADAGRRFDASTTTDDRVRGEPDAVKVARPVRRAAWGNGPVATSTPRPRPTQLGGG
jgi:hypothetical protein